MQVKQGMVKQVEVDGSNIKVQLLGDTTNIEYVKNATRRKLVVGQLVIVHYRGPALTPNEPAYITSVLEGAVD